MPNLNVKGESPRPAPGAPSGGGGGKSKTLIIVFVVIVALAGAAFILNTTGIVKLWGKKKAQPVLVTTPSETVTPMTEATPTPPPVDTMQENPAVEENLTKLKSNATSLPAAEPKKMIVTGSGMYTIQISTWPTRTLAEKHADVFANAGFESFVEKRGAYFRVCIGRYETKKAARTRMAKMEHMLESMPLVSTVGNK